MSLCAHRNYPPYKKLVRQAVARWFNHHHVKARSITERMFGIMKICWRVIFFKALEVKPTISPEVIACCAKLHNICMSNGDIMEPAQEVFRPDDNADEPHHHQDQQSREHEGAHGSSCLLLMVRWQLWRTIVTSKKKKTVFVNKFCVIGYLICIYIYIYLYFV